MPQIIPIKDLKNSPEKMIEYLSYVLKNSFQVYYPVRPSNEKSMTD